MALVLVKETGTGSSTANSYASAADGDSYHLGHLYATDWTGASTSNKEKALVMATRLIDASYQFSGFKAVNDQALQWPREQAIDPDRRNIVWSALQTVLGPFYESDEIPPALLQATCEMARELIALDRTAAPEGEGVTQFTLTGTLSITYNSKDRMPIISHVAQLLLSKLGNLLNEREGSAQLIRT